MKIRSRLLKTERQLYKTKNSFAKYGEVTKSLNQVTAEITRDYAGGITESLNQVSVEIVETL